MTQAQKRIEIFIREIAICKARIDYLKTNYHLTSYCLKGGMERPIDEIKKLENHIRYYEVRIDKERTTL